MHTIPGYELHEQLYESTCSIIYRAHRQMDDLPVILKFLKDEYPVPTELARFKREYEITRHLKIDGVIEVYKLLPYKNTLVMELEDFGADALANILKTRRLEFREFLRLAIRITDILGRIHQQGIIHKDINPANIIWNPDTDHLKIIDFGISTTLPREQPEIRNPEVLEGTLAYISPEQTGRMNRSVDYRSDFYSLGATLYHLLTGQPPFQADDALELVCCHLSRMPPPPYEILPHPTPLPDGEGAFLPSPLRRGVGGEVLRLLSAIILKLMAKNAEDRYQSAFGLKADLEWCLAHLNVPGTFEVPGTFVKFELGQHDRSNRFQVPQKLYGREQEIAALLAAFDRIATPQSELSDLTSDMLLVAGYSGIGKSALVHEIHKPITSKRGYFIEGKFDQFQRNEPYSALIKAFQRLVCQLLTETEARMTWWKEQLLNALGPNGQVMIDVIPEVALLIGSQPAVPELPPAQAQNRFHFTFQNFICTFTAPEHPLVIFLDDLQWADSSSLQLLKLLMTGSQIQYVLIIGAYRDNEVNAAHPLMLMLKDIQHAGATINTITLVPLALNDVAQLIADTLAPSRPDRFSETYQVYSTLAEICHQKTGGNPFFLTQFLESLYAEGLLTFNPQTLRWQWDVDAIRQAGMTENVVDLLVHNIQKFPEAAQQVLQLAACIGNQFDLPTLALIHEHSHPETLQDLWAALQEGLIVPLDESYKYIAGNAEFPSWEGQGWVNSNFKFLHDRVQQAAYSLIEETDRARQHLAIGRLLHEHLTQADHEERLFEIVDHYNSGKSLIQEQREKDALASLNLNAGRKAKASATYHAADTYFQTGVELLADDAWQQNYNLCLALHTEAAEAAYLIGHFDRMEQLAQIVEQRAAALLDKVKACEIRVHAYFAQNKLLKSIQTALPVLRMLGVTFPPKPGKLHFLLNILITKLALFRYTPEVISQLPEMTDPYKLVAMRLMITMSSAAYIGLPNLLPLIGFKGVRLSLAYGNAPASTYIYSGFGMILSVFQGDIETGYRFGQLAVHLVDRLHAAEFAARTISIVNFLIKHWKEPLRDTLVPLQQAYQRGLDTGDLEFAAISAFTYIRHAYLSGTELTHLEREAASYTAIASQLKQNMAYNMLCIDWQSILNLIGDDDDSALPLWLLEGKAYSEKKRAPLHQQVNEYAVLFSMACQTLILCYLFGEYSQAVNYAERAAAYIDGVIGMFITPVFYFYDSLTRLALFPDVSKAEQRRFLRKAAANQKKMKKWARHAPMNHLHKWQLVEAERARVLGKDAEAMELYDKAIAGAKTNEYINEEALVNELAARFWLTKKKEDFAVLYLKRAHQLYGVWGAKRKVRELERAYPYLSARKKVRITLGTDGTIQNSLTDTTETTSDALDLATVIKTSQILAAEIRPDTLFSSMMHIVMDNVGASRGVVVCKDDQSWKIEADSHPESQSAAESPFPLSMVNYTERTQEPVVVQDVSQENLFAHDPYILLRQPKALLCVPLINQQRLAGILYLENTLTAGVFTLNRLNLLKLLSTQMAIAIENARLWNHLEQEVTKRTREAEEARKIAENANQAKNDFLSHISHELRTPLTNILIYPQILRDEQTLTDRQRETVITIQRSGEHLLSLINDLADLSKIEARKIELQADRFPLPQFLNNLVKNARERAKNTTISIIAVLAPDLPAAVDADEKRLRQILQNLLNNAIKFTEKGSVTLRVHIPPSQTRKHKNTQTLLFEVKDTGIGIPAEELEKIFTPFYQVKSGRSRAEGSGLGLAISQQLVCLMGGELRVKSVAGQGTSFWFELEFPVSAEVQVISRSQSTRHITGYHGDRRRILIADDHEENRKLFMNMLGDLGFDVIEAFNGQDALTKAREGQPHVILMDLSMPVIDGFEAARRIRQFPDLQNVVILGLSATVSDQRKQEALAAGCDAFLAKPFQLHEFLECLAHHAQIAWTYQEPDQADLVSSQPSEFVIPPQTVLQELLELAEGGYIDEVQDAIDRLKASDPPLRPFLSEIETFAAQYDLEQIMIHLHRYVKIEDFRITT